MITNFIKLFSIIYGYIYVYQKISSNPFSIIFSKRKRLGLLFTLTIISLFLNYQHPQLSYFIPFLIFWIIVSYYTNQPQRNFVTTVLAFTISFCLHCFFSLIVLLALCIIFTNKNDFPFTLLAIMSTILHISMLSALFKNKRFRKGMPFLIKNNSLNFATIISLLVIMLTFYFSGNYPNSSIRNLALIISLFTLAFLIYWWQAQITKSYRRSLEKRELESLRTEGLEKDAIIEKLMADNDRLATITHRDNTLISTLKNSTVNYLMTDFASKEEAVEARDKLIANIESLSEGRASLLTKSSAKNGREFDTGISLLDELLHYMDEEAITNNILFSVHNAVVLADFVPKEVSESKLVHVIDDLLKNAFKATKNNERRMVQLQFYKLGKDFVVEVADNGIPFEVQSLVNMGIEKMTTYEDGSGIGLMDIWNTKEARRATYHLEEYATPSPFTKKISITFDKKNRYSIRTYRKDEIQKASKRIDLQIY